MISSTVASAAWLVDGHCPGIMLALLNLFGQPAAAGNFLRNYKVHTLHTSYMCIYIYIYLYTHMYIYIYMYTHIYTFKHVYICTYICMCICIYIYIHIHV